jgi:hypothetical protein
MTSSPTQDQYNSYNLAFDYFNRELFAGGLSPCLLNFSRKARAAGFFSPESWSRREGGTTAHEISLNPDVLAREPVEIMGTLVHEMVHLWQQEHGPPSRSTYHNTEWAGKMEEVGLMPSNTGQPGGKRTGQRMTHYVIEGGPFQRAFAAMPPESLLPWISGRPAGRGGPVRPGPDRQDKVTYGCPGCQARVWGKAGLRLACEPCGQHFVRL